MNQEEICLTDSSYCQDLRKNPSDLTHNTKLSLDQTLDKETVDLSRQESLLLKTDSIHKKAGR